MSAPTSSRGPFYRASGGPHAPSAAAAGARPSGPPGIAPTQGLAGHRWCG